jgi:hypothetical protein
MSLININRILQSKIKSHFSTNIASKLSHDSKTKDSTYKKTPKGKFDAEFDDSPKSYTETEPLEPFENNTNPHTGEIGGPKGPEPTRYGDWERKGRCIDF